MENSGQNLGNHTRWHPPYHFVMMPMLLIHFLYSAYHLWQYTGWDTLEGVMLAVALVMLGLFARLNALKAQDRVIRLEEQLRFQRVLPAAQANQALTGITVPQHIALRFASDAELSELVGKVLSGNLAAPDDIKKAIKNWRGDYTRV
jgi:Family of unknown function (DUF6526)